MLASRGITPPSVDRSSQLARSRASPWACAVALLPSDSRFNGVENEHEPPHSMRWQTSGVWLHWGGMVHPECGLHRSVDWGPRPNTKEKTSLHLSCFLLHMQHDQYVRASLPGWSLPSNHNKRDPYFLYLLLLRYVFIVMRKLLCQAQMNLSASFLHFLFFLFRILFHMYECFTHMYVCAPCAGLVPMKISEGHHIPWYWS